VFVTHAAQDASIAKLFKNQVDKDFLGLCTVFVSSSLDSIHAGEEWLRAIKESIQKAEILVGLLSPIALTRGWVFFEFGAAWAREIPAVSVCHSGLTPNQLTPPLAALQALEIGNPEHLRHLYELISKAIGCNLPDANFQQMAAHYHDITETARINTLLREWTKSLLMWNAQMKDLLDGKLASIPLLVPAHLDSAFEEYVKLTAARGFLRITRAGMAMGTPVGPQASVFQCERGETVDELVKLMH
jgi:hypothetical protein